MKRSKYNPHPRENVAPNPWRGEEEGCENYQFLNRQTSQMLRRSLKKITCGQRKWGWSWSRYFYRAGLFSEDHCGEKTDTLPEMLKWTQSICENYPRSFMRDRSSYGRHLFTLISKYVISDIYFLILLNKLFVLALLNCLYILYGETSSIPL
jgi:hypothetical protein